MNGSTRIVSVEADRKAQKGLTVSAQVILLIKSGYHSPSHVR